MQLILAIILGFAFGFALDRAKASNPENGKLLWEKSEALMKAIGY